MNDNNDSSTHDLFTSQNEHDFNNYSALVHNKISKELLDPVLLSNCDDCSKVEVAPLSGEKYENKLIVIAQTNGVLGTHFCENINNLDLKISDHIIIKIDREFEYAKIIETGNIVNFRTINNGNGNNTPVPKIERIINEKDSERHKTNLQNSLEARKVFLDFNTQLKLEMKLVDVHLQFDRKKMFFFYTADGRVDFRELAKKLASHFKTRIELRQIGVRDEAKRLGGVATCGREFCCSSFMNSFKRITTDIAVENNISTSISKYTGPCGKLKCCLSFEIDV